MTLYVRCPECLLRWFHRTGCTRGDTPPTEEIVPPKPNPDRRLEWLIDSMREEGARAAGITYPSAASSRHVRALLAEGAQTLWRQREETRRLRRMVDKLLAKGTP